MTKRLFYWLPKEPNGTPDSVIVSLWSSLQAVASERSFQLHPFHSAADLARLVHRHGRPDLLHIGKAPMLWPSARSRAFALGAALKLRMSTHMHGDAYTELAYLWRQRPMTALQKTPVQVSSPLLWRGLRLIVVNSARMAHLTAKMCGLGPTIEVIPNAVDLSFWTRPRVGAGRHSGSPYLFSHGRLVLEKGYDLLIQAMAKAGCKERLVLAGTGPAERELRRLADHHGVRLELVGWQSGAQIRDWLQGARAAVYPSRYEAFSLAALEALLCARSVVISEAAGLLEFLPSAIRATVAATPSVDGLCERLRAPWPEVAALGEEAERFSPSSVASAYGAAVLRVMES
jgi:glycosyltransferase involved in cell wall biosynthesis